MKPTLVFKDVTRRYGDVVALNRFSLEVEPGITALVGPNAAGKSTFMRLATGHVRPTAGQVSAFGETVWDNPGLMANVGYVPEQDAFWEGMTGVQFVATLARLGGMPKEVAGRRAREELQALGLDHGLDRPIKGYSKGMRQRVKLAQALVHQPRLIYLDEPMLGCDPVARRRIQDRIRELADAGRTVIISTHILPEVERLTKRIAIIHQGRLVARGDANEVRAALGNIPSRVRMLCASPRKAAQDLMRSDLVHAVNVEKTSVVLETDNLRAFLMGLHKSTPPAWGYVGHETLDTDLTSLFGHLTGGGA